MSAENKTVRPAEQQSTPGNTDTGIVASGQAPVKLDPEALDLLWRIVELLEEQSQQLANIHGEMAYISSMMP